MHLRIRPIRRSDMDDIVEIIKSSKYDFSYGFYLNAYRLDKDELWYRFLGYKKFPTLVAEIDGRVVGLATLEKDWDNEDYLYIGLLIVHADYRGLGVGSALIKESFKLAVEHEFRGLSLHTWASNKARYLYSRRGFCWVSNFFGYMINYLAQLYKAPQLKKILPPPQELLDRLESEPQKVIVNGHVAWEYRIILDNGKLRVVVSEKNGRLLELEAPNIKIKLEPPKKRDYIKDEEVPINLTANAELPVRIDDKLYLLKPDTNLSLLVKAKKDVKIQVGEYNFGFGLDLQDEYELAIRYVGRIGSTRILELVITNNGDKPLENLLQYRIIGNLKILDTPRTPIKIQPKSTRTLKIKLVGEGVILFSFGEQKKRVVLSQDFLWTDDEAENKYWKVSSDEIRYRAYPYFNIYYDIILPDRRLDLESKDSAFKYSDDEISVFVYPQTDGDELVLRTVITAKKALEGDIILNLWMSFMEDFADELLIPHNGHLLLIPLSMAFPMTMSITKQKIPEGWIGLKMGSHSLIVNIGDAKISLIRPSAIRLSWPVKLEAWQSAEFEIRFSVVDTKYILSLMETVRPIEVFQRGPKLVIRNYWFHDLETKILLDDKTVYEGKLESAEEKEIPLELRGFKEADLTIWFGKTSIKRKLNIALPQPPSENLTPRIRIDERSNLQSLITYGKELIFWSEEPTYFSLLPEKSHGGTPILLKEKGRYFQITNLPWECKGNTCILEFMNLVLTRRWMLLPPNGILEEIEIVNNDYKRRTFSLHTYYLLRERIIQAENPKGGISSEAFWSVLGDKGKILTESSTLLAYSLTRKTRFVRETLNVDRPLEHSAILYFAEIDLLPKERATLKHAIIIREDTQNHS